MASAKRNENETFKSYRARLSAQAEADKERSKGRVIWASSQRGTYMRAKHGAIGAERVAKGLRAVAQSRLSVGLDADF